MNENIKKFLEKVQQSPELQAKFAQIRNPDEAYKLAASIQDGFSKEEFIAEMKKLYEAAIQDLSDEDIAKIAGGLSDEAEAAIATAVGSAASISISIAISLAAM